MTSASESANVEFVGPKALNWLLSPQCQKRCPPLGLYDGRVAKFLCSPSPQILPRCVPILSFPGPLEKDPNSLLKHPQAFFYSFHLKIPLALFSASHQLAYMHKFWPNAIHLLFPIKLPSFSFTLVTFWKDNLDLLLLWSSISFSLEFGCVLSKIIGDLPHCPTAHLSPPHFPVDIWGCWPFLLTPLSWFWAMVPLPLLHGAFRLLICLNVVIPCRFILLILLNVCPLPYDLI